MVVVIVQLRAKIAEIGGEPIAGPEQTAEVESPIEMIGLNRVRNAFDVEHRLVELQPIGEDVVGGRRIGIGRSAEIHAAFHPAVHLDPGLLPGFSM